MNVIFDFSQLMLRQVLALLDSNEEIILFCVNCDFKIDPTNITDNSIFCPNCSSEAVLESLPKSRREIVWEEFEKKMEEQNKK